MGTNSHYPFKTVSHSIRTRDSPLLPTTEPIETLAARAIERTHALIGTAEHHYRVTIPFPQILFDLRGRAAGQLHIHRNGLHRIRYNSAIFSRHPEDFLAQTVPHETAHLIAFRLHGTAIRPHGNEWQRIMLTFGARPERCHSYNIDGLSTRRIMRFDYHCRCQTYRLTSIRHRRIQAGQTYHCRRCGGDLRYGAHPSDI